jgi:hypothetical protein
MKLLVKSVYEILKKTNNNLCKNIIIQTLSVNLTLIF